MHDRREGHDDRRGPLGRLFAAAASIVASLVLAAAVAACAVGPAGLSAGANGSARGGSAGSDRIADPMNGSITQFVPPGTPTVPAAPAGRPSTAKVAMILPMSGPGQTAMIAKAMKQAGELALFDHGDTDLQLIVKDDAGTPEGARAAAEEAVRDGAELILGPLMSASVKAATPVARAAGIPVIAFSNDRQALDNGVFLLSFMAEPEVERIIGYAAKQGRRNFAALLPDDGYGHLLEAAFVRAVGNAQGNVVTVERYQGTGTGMLEPTRRVVEAMSRSAPGGNGTDALFLPGGPETLASIGPLLAYAKLDTTRIKLLGSGGWDGPNVGRDATLVGAWYPAPDPHGWQAFAEKFGKTFGSVPPRIATLSFDAVGIALTLAGDPSGRRYTAASLMRPNGFTGADGEVHFQADGTALRTLSVLEVQPFGATVADQGGVPSGAAPPAAVSALPAIRDGAPAASPRAVTINPAAAPSQL